MAEIPNPYLQRASLQIALSFKHTGCHQELYVRCLAETEFLQLYTLT